MLALSLLMACQGAPPTPAGLTPIGALTSTSSPTFTPQSGASESGARDSAGNPAGDNLPSINPTAVLAAGGENAVQEASPTEPVSTTAPDPFRFVFPAQGPAPVSAWRPPLYPTPWAPTPYDHFYFARPIAADEVNWPLWDYRYGGTFFADVVHTGVDIPAARGTPVLAAGSGKVVWAGYGLYRGGEDPSDPYGLAVAIHHDFGYQDQSLYSVYGHLDRVDVTEGQYVKVGEPLGIVGETGRVTGPHLHFEVRVGQNEYFNTRNPELWLVPPQGWGVLAGRVMDSGAELKTVQDVIVTSLSSRQNWLAKSYGPEAINRDPYYQENVVIGDLPAGRYEVRIPYAGINYTLEIEILPGRVSYFTFKGHASFTSELPPTPGAQFTPPPATAVPSATQSAQ